METKEVRRDIPSHVVLFHILPRLPITSLQRCRSVCKQWYSFLKTRTFANIHTHLVTIGDHKLKPKLVILYTTERREYYSSRPRKYEFRIIENCEAHEDASGDSHPLPFETNVKYLELLSSLDGLVCVGGKGYNDNLLVLWNPLTGEYKHVKAIMKENYRRLALGMYYSSCDDDYKLVVVFSDHSVYIYSLKSESWRMVDSTHNYQTLSSLQGYYYWKKSTYLNGYLYFLCCGCYYTRFSIMKFDTKNERFGVIPTPPSLNADPDAIKRLNMEVERGVIHLGVNYGDENSYIQLWRMIRDGNWDKVGTPYMVKKYMYPLFRIKNKTWLMTSAEDHLWKVDLGKKLDTRIGKENFTNIINRAISCETVVNYTETFIQLDRSI